MYHLNFVFFINSAKTPSEASGKKGQERSIDCGLTGREKNEAQGKKDKIKGSHHI